MPIYELPRIPRVNKQPPIQSIAEQMAYYTHETTVTTDAAATTTTTTTKVCFTLTTYQLNLTSISPTGK